MAGIKFSGSPRAHFKLSNTEEMYKIDSCSKLPGPSRDFSRSLGLYISRKKEMLAMPERQVGDENEDGAVDVHHAVLVQVLLQVDDAQDEGDHLKQ